MTATPEWSFIVRHRGLDIVTGGNLCWSGRGETREEARAAAIRRAAAVSGIPASQLTSAGGGEPENEAARLLVAAEAQWRALTSARRFAIKQEKPSEAVRTGTVQARVLDALVKIGLLDSSYRHTPFGLAVAAHGRKAGE